jgi:hypothetical protein
MDHMTGFWIGRSLASDLIKMSASKNQGKAVTESTR